MLLFRCEPYIEADLTGFTLTPPSDNYVQWLVNNAPPDFVVRSATYKKVVVRVYGVTDELALPPVLPFAESVRDGDGMSRVMTLWPGGAAAPWKAFTTPHMLTVSVHASDMALRNIAAWLPASVTNGTVKAPETATRTRWTATFDTDVCTPPKAFRRELEEIIASHFNIWKGLLVSVKLR
jgi:hypothetical protein